MILLFLVVSCSVNGGPGEETVDPTQRWLSAKCPPMETCGPQRSPESLVIAWLIASENGLCSVVTKFTSPDHPDIATEYCGATDSYIIDNIIVREKTESIDGKPNLKEVIIDGIIKFTFQGESGTREKWSILVEKLDGKWYVIDGYR